MQHKTLIQHTLALVEGVCVPLSKTTHKLTFHSPTRFLQNIPETSKNVSASATEDEVDQTPLFNTAEHPHYHWCQIQYSQRFAAGLLGAE